MEFKEKQISKNVVYLSLLQNLFCINRTNHLEKRLYRILGNVIFSVSLITVIVSNILEIITTLKNYTNLSDLSTSKLFAYFFQCILGVELSYLAISAKCNDNIYAKLMLLEEKCVPTTVKDANDNSRKLIFLSLLSAAIDIIGYNILDYSASVTITLTVAFTAHDTELLLYSVIIQEFNGKLTTLMDVTADVGNRMYRHILIATVHFSEDFKITICFILVMTLAITVIYIGAAIAIEGPRTHKVLSYFVWRELRSLFSLWLLCSASHQTRILCDKLVKCLSERLVFEVDSRDSTSRAQLKRWLKCVKVSPVGYFDGSSYTLAPVLPLSLLDYSTNYFLIIVQMYPVLINKKRKNQPLDSP